MNLQEFKDFHAGAECPFQYHVPEMQATGIHNFSLGTQYGYYELAKYLDDPNLFLSYVFGWAMFRRGRWVCFCYDAQGLETWKQLPGKKTITTATDKREKYWGLLDETCYDLNTVLDESSFRHSELRRKVLRQPFTQLLPRLSIRDFSEEGVYEIGREINREWAEVKRGDPNLHQNTFPSGRYINLWPRILAAQARTPFHVYAHMYYVDGQPFGFKIGTLENGVYHLLSSETKFWLPDAPKMSTWLNTLFFDQLHREHPEIHTANFGLAFDKGLRKWKAQWQHSYRNYYAITAKE